MTDEQAERLIKALEDLLTEMRAPRQPQYVGLPQPYPAPYPVPTPMPYPVPHWQPWPGPVYPFDPYRIGNTCGAPQAIGIGHDYRTSLS